MSENDLSLGTDQRPWGTAVPRKEEKARFAAITFPCDLGPRLQGQVCGTWQEVGCETGHVQLCLL